MGFTGRKKYNKLHVPTNFMVKETECLLHAMELVKRMKHSIIQFNLLIIITVSDYYEKKINQPYCIANR